MIGVEQTLLMDDLSMVCCDINECFIQERRINFSKTIRRSELWFFERKKAREAVSPSGICFRLQ